VSQRGAASLPFITPSPDFFTHLSQAAAAAAAAGGGVCPPSRVRGVATALPERELTEAEAALFGHLRVLRGHLALTNLPNPISAHTIAYDSTLRELARVRPGSPASLLPLKNIGVWWVTKYGAAFLKTISEESSRLGLTLAVDVGERDVDGSSAAAPNPNPNPSLSAVTGLDFLPSPPPRVNVAHGSREESESSPLPPRPLLTPLKLERFTRVMCGGESCERLAREKSIKAETIASDVLFAAFEGGELLKMDPRTYGWEVEGGGLLPRAGELPTPSELHSEACHALDLGVRRVLGACGEGLFPPAVLSEALRVVAQTIFDTRGGATLPWYPAMYGENPCAAASGGGTALTPNSLLLTLKDLKLKSLVCIARAPPGSDPETTKIENASSLYFALRALMGCLGEYPHWIREFHCSHCPPSSGGLNKRSRG